MHYGSQPFTYGLSIKSIAAHATISNYQKIYSPAIVLQVLKVSCTYINVHTITESMQYNIIIQCMNPIQIKFNTP